MKCDICEHQKLEIGIISGLYCAKDHWEGNDVIEDPEKDPWENCEDYEPINKYNLK